MGGGASTSKQVTCYMKFAIEHETRDEVGEVNQRQARPEAVTSACRDAIT